MSARDSIYETPTGNRARPEAVELRRWIHAQYLADPEPLPGRFRYYEAIMDEAITKHAAETVLTSSLTGAATATVTAGDKMWQAALLWVREHGLVPDGWVLDTTRSMRGEIGWDSIEEAVKAQIEGARLDPWAGDRPLVLVESEASAAALDPVAAEFQVQVVPCRGQASRSFLMNEVAPTMYEGQVVLEIVDLDKVGGDIGNSAKIRLQRRTGHRFDWRPLALTDDQVTFYGITRVPRVDHREKPAVTRMVAETEALGVVNLRAILSTALTELLPEPLVSVRAREEAERAALLDRLAA